MGDVIMVDRGNCTFTRKAKTAQNANASAILIINNQKGRYWVFFFFPFCFFLCVRGCYFSSWGSCLAVVSSSYTYFFFHVKFVFVVCRTLQDGLRCWWNWSGHTYTCGHASTRCRCKAGKNADKYFNWWASFRFSKYLWMFFCACYVEIVIVSV